MTNQETNLNVQAIKKNTSTSPVALRISGYGVETFAGEVDIETYKFFEENDIDLEEYSNMIDFGDEDSLEIPDEHNFGANGITEVDNIWHINGAYLSEDNLIEVLDDAGDVIWQSDCDPESLEDVGITLIVTSNYDDLVEELEPNHAMLVGRLFQKGTIFDTSISDIDEFDASNLTIYYFEDESGWIISSIEYDGEALDNEDSFSQISGSEFIWESRQEDEIELEDESTHSKHEIFVKETTSNDIISEEDDLDTIATNIASVEITEPAMVIRISQAYREDMTPQELYDVTRSAWKVNLDRANTIDYAFAVYKGEIKEIYKVAGWHEAGTTFVPKRDDIIDSGRFEFVGTVAEDAIRDKYLNKSVKHMFKKGAVIPTMYVNCQAKRSIVYTKKVAVINVSRTEMHL